MSTLNERNINENENKPILEAAEIIDDSVSNKETPIYPKPTDFTGTTVYTNFESMGLDNCLVRSIYSYGFERPSTIQQRAIVPIANGLDVVAQAQSGTGKTATFTIGVLNRININLQQTQALILCPTRELALQTTCVVTKMGDPMGITCIASIGGTKIPLVQDKLRSKPHVIVGTPGRVFDMVNRQFIDVKNLSVVVLDEADEMLSRGFSEQIDGVFNFFPKDIQIVLVSATFPDEVYQISRRFMRNPVDILIKKDELTLEGIRQYFINVGEDKNKFSTLLDIYQYTSISQTVIFCNSIRRVEDIVQKLKNQEFSVLFIHGEMEQNNRNEALRMFREGKARVLVSTDLMARGIDVQQVSAVINYDVPKNVESYLHRIGRSGRFGRKGVALNFFNEDDITMLDALQTHYSIAIAPVPEDIQSVFTT